MTGRDRGEHMSRGDIDQSADRADAARGPRGAEPTKEESAAAAAVLRLIWGTQMARAVYVMAKLGIADLLADAPLTAAQLAQATQAHVPSAGGIWPPRTPGSASATVTLTPSWDTSP